MPQRSENLAHYLVVSPNRVLPVVPHAPVICRRRMRAGQRLLRIMLIWALKRGNDAIVAERGQRQTKHILGIRCIAVKRKHQNRAWADFSRAMQQIPALDFHAERASLRCVWEHATEYRS